MEGTTLLRRADSVVDYGRRSGLLGRDSWTDMFAVAAMFVLYWLLDVWSLGAASLDQSTAEGSSLLLAAIGESVLIWLGVVPLIALAVWKDRKSLACAWGGFEHGERLRVLIAPLVVLLAWQGAIYDYNYLLNQAHLVDRGLLLILGIGVFWRPLFLMPFVVQARVISAQFELPFATTAAQNMDGLLLMGLIVVSAGHLFFVATARRDTSPILLVLLAALAAHFFVPGFGKVRLDWLTHEDLANLPVNAHNIGWLGQTDGTLSRRISELFDRLGPVLRLGALAFELSSVVAIFHRRLMRFWIPVAVLFHVVNFVVIGYWFFAWIVFEIGLFILLGRAELREWIDRNFTLGRIAIVAVAVVFGGRALFHPAALTWIDSPVSYGYEMEAVGASGAEYHVPIAAFAPFEQELAFSRPQLGSPRPLTGPYGVVASGEALADLKTLRHLTDVSAHESGVLAEADGQRAADFFGAFLVHANHRSRSPNLVETMAVAAPMSKYWSARPAPTYEFQEPIERLEVFRTTSLRTEDGVDRHRRPVLVLEYGADGQLRIDHRSQ